MSDEPREYTEEEVRERFLDHVRTMVQYWADPQTGPGYTCEKRLSGLAFSLLVLLDGGTELPSFIVAPQPHPDDREFNRSEGEKRELEPEYRERKNAGVRAAWDKNGDQYREAMRNSDCLSNQPEWKASYNKMYREENEVELAELALQRYWADPEAARAAAQIRNRLAYLANPQAAIDKADQRRARMRGNPWEAINRKGIYERDGWRCGICGGKVDRMLEYPDPESPSLDHIIPISHDGPHLASNVRLAHLGCNLGRGNGFGLNGDQLLLIG